MSLKDAQDYTLWLYWRAMALYVAWGLATFGLTISPLGRDDSDPDAWGPRSGIAVRTDHYNGCQYLESSRGHLVPRVDGSGRHVGCEL